MGYLQSISIYLCLFPLMLRYQPSTAESDYEGNCSRHGAFVRTDPSDDVSTFCTLNLSKVEGNNASNVVYYCRSATISSRYVTVLNETSSLWHSPSADRSGYGAVGWTDPLSEGDILCTLDFGKVEGSNASNIALHCNSTTASPRYVTALNETTSFLRIPTGSISQCVHYCKLRTNVTAVYRVTNLKSSSPLQVHDTDGKFCVDNVVLGTKPAPAENVSCISYNFKRMVCNWTVPYNPIETEYKASYRGTPGNRRFLDCPENQNLRYSNSCTWMDVSDPFYSPMSEYFDVKVTGTNIFGSSSVLYKFHNFARMMLPAPTDITVENSTTTSAYLSWKANPSLINYRRLTYKMECTRFKIVRGPIEEFYQSEGKFKYNLTGLPYPNTNYNFTFYERMDVTNESDVLWSEPGSFVATTKSCAPYRPPKIATGTFRVKRGSDGKRDVHVYWQSLLPEEQNGADFHYKVSGKMLNDENDAGVDIEPLKVYEADAVFFNVSSSSYRFRIVSANKEGESSTSSEVFLPAANDIIEAPENLSSTDFGNGDYEISWQYSTNSKNITNFTVFWCESAQPLRCEGRLSFNSCSPDLNTINVSTSEPKKPYKFAVSANSDRSSSGMKTVECNVFAGDVGKVKPVHISNVGANFIQVNLRPECLAPKIIEVFHVFYWTDNGPERNITVPFDYSSPSVDGNITDLKPNTRYNISVAGGYNKKIGQRSVEAIASTREESPAVWNWILTALVIIALSPIILLGRIGIRKFHKMKAVDVTMPPPFSDLAKEKSPLLPCNNNDESHRDVKHKDGIDKTVPNTNRTDEGIDQLKHINSFPPAEFEEENVHLNNGYRPSLATYPKIIATVKPDYVPMYPFPFSNDHGAAVELRDIASSLSTEYEEKGVHPNNGYPVPDRETSKLITPISASDLNPHLPAAGISSASTSSAGSDRAYVCTLILPMNYAASTVAVPETGTSATSDYITIGRLMSSNDHGSTIARHKMSKNGFVAVASNTTPDLASQDAATGTVPRTGYCRVAEM